MNKEKNTEIRELINKILASPGDSIPPMMLRSLTDMLCDCEMYCPVKNDRIILITLGPRTFIPASCDLEDIERTFGDEEIGIFEFNRLEEFITDEVHGIIINPGSHGFILNDYLSKLVFSKKRPVKEVREGYDVKVRLNDFRPLTWRDLIIPDNITFMELDDILKTLWGFDGSHLSCFLIRKDNLTIIDKDLSDETMMKCDFDANTTPVSEIFDRYNKVTYWYDFGDDWRFDIEIKKKVAYDKDYVTIKRFKGKYNPIEDCQGVYGLSEIVYYAENPDEADSSYFSDMVEYLREFNMEYSQISLENKAYVHSTWHGNLFK